MDIDALRRQNIKILEAQLGGISKLAEAAKMSYTQCLNYRNGVPDSQTGKPRGMRKETAWRFEDAGNKPRGWLDQDHSGPGLTPDEQTLLDGFRAADLSERATLLTLANAYIARAVESSKAA